jgi:hypothetical protein
MTPRRVDANQGEIVAALRAMGAHCQDLHNVGQGCPDILVGFRQRNYLFEIKAPNGRLTIQESMWRLKWDGQVDTIKTADEAIAVITREEA